jgi:hypothetical protein
MVSFALANQGCSDDPRSVGELDGRDAGADTMLGLDAAPSCRAEIEREATARVLAAVGCFSGYVTSVPGSSEVRAFWGVSGSVDSYQFHLCDGSSGNQLAQLQQTATAALQGMETEGCQFFTSIGNSDVRRVIDAIIACGGVYYAVVFDSSGAVSDVRSEAMGGGEAGILSCILTAVADLAIPCLADAQICSSVILH